VHYGHLDVAPAIVRFKQRHEKVRCSVRLYDRTVNLLEEGIDVGIRISPLEDSSLVAQTLGTIRRVVAASPAYLAQHGTPRHPRDLAGAPCVRGRIDAPAQWLFRDGGKTISVTPNNRLEFNHLAPAIESCAAGMGFGTFFSYQVMPHVVQGRLKLVLEDFEPPPLSRGGVKRRCPASRRRAIRGCRAGRSRCPASAAASLRVPAGQPAPPPGP
jgi:DNA-binding transcriptional LysR family regulator